MDPVEIEKWRAKIQDCGLDCNRFDQRQHFIKYLCTSCNSSYSLDHENLALNDPLCFSLCSSCYQNYRFSQTPSLPSLNTMNPINGAPKRTLFPVEIDPSCPLLNKRVSTDPRDYAFSSKSRKRLREVNAGESEIAQIYPRTHQNTRTRPHLGPLVPFDRLRTRFNNFSPSSGVLTWTQPVTEHLPLTLHNNTTQLQDEFVGVKSLDCAGEHRPSTKKTPGPRENSMGLERDPNQDAQQDGEAFMKQEVSTSIIECRLVRWLNAYSRTGKQLRLWFV